MGLLDNAKNELDRAERKAGKVPSYNKDGSIKSKWKTVLTAIGIFIVLIGAIVAAIHIPVLTYKPQRVVSQNKMYLKPNESGIKFLLEYAKDHPNDDFDNDGLVNSDETNQGTDLRNPDSDLDGVSDYAEIYTFNSRPNEKDDQIVSFVNDKLKANNIDIRSPYKINDIVMWADNIYSRSCGTVIPTIRGYRFSRFNGWAQFPGNNYAYKVIDGFHIPLQYRKAENAWYISSQYEDIEVECFEEPLETVHLLTLFGRKYFVEEGFLSNLLDIILPKEHSFATFDSVVKEDFQDEEVTATITGTEMPNFDRNDTSRFGVCTNTMDDLSKTLTFIKSGKPVIVSLQSSSYGEVICLAYGYTNEYGDLLIADENGNTKADDGKPYMLNITEKSAITIDQNSDLRQREYFDFSGMGYDSQSGDKIHFIYPD